tara:strand:+ start:96 stop:539 length:444 start_codon:yes stop_codon:yes gene_type:complete
MAVTLNSTGITFSDGTSISAPTTYAGIGSVAFAFIADTIPDYSVYGITNQGATIAKGTTRAGSGLRVSNLPTSDAYGMYVTYPQVAGGLYAPGGFVLIAGARPAAWPDNTSNVTTLAGTWRCMSGGMLNSWVSNNARWFAHMFVRIS